MATYVIVHVEKVKDPAGLQRYLAILPPILAKFGGEFIMRGRPVERLMGAWEPEMYALGRSVLKTPNRSSVGSTLTSTRNPKHCSNNQPM